MAKRRTASRKRPRRAAATGPGTTAALKKALRAVERRLQRSTAALAALKAAQQKKLAAVRRAADRKLAVVVRELAALRHHEARATALERMVKEYQAAAAVEQRGDGETPRTAG
jgi:hypothetical protein